MSWRITASGPASLGLLDQYGGAAAAYSLRNLSIYNASPVVRVRRSSDNTESDFTAMQVTDGTLATFCGAGNGFVRTWYDQSGNGRHTTQTSSTQQFQIVSSGNLLILNGKPAMTADGVNDFMRTPITATQFNDLSLFVVGQVTDSLKSNLIVANLQFDIARLLTNGWGQRLGEDLIAVVVSLTNQETTPRTSLPAAQSIMYGNISRSTLELNHGYNDLSLISRSITGSTFRSSDEGSALYTASSIQEFIAYPSNQNANRSNIQFNINAHYATY
jgi:hypothetical protein